MKKALVALAAVLGLSAADMMSDSLAAHNNERNAHGVPSLTWSSTLAQTAQAYAEVMASTGTTSHSTGRVNVGENLAWGSGSNIDTTSLAGLWIDEKQYYIPGMDFPDCSTTGSWHDVAHYTQLMWEETTELGCGLAQSSSGRNYYVCHYSPQGNIDGEPVYTEAASIDNTQDQADPVTTDPVTTDPTTQDGSDDNNNKNNYNHGYTRGGRNHDRNQDNNSNQIDTVTIDPTTTNTTNTTNTTAPATTNPTANTTNNTTSQSSGSQDQFIADSLAAHNNEREAYGIPALAWSDSLAQTAQAYAQVMANTGTTSHSSKADRPNVGENLAWGSGSSVNTIWLADLWLAEKKYFIAGCTFPDCSTTGNWDDVSHYTQLMWEQTTEVGCGLAQGSSGRWNYVCHYSPRGNMDGEPVYSGSPAGNTQSQAAPVTTDPTTSTTDNTTAPVTTPVTTNSTSTSTSTPTTNTTATQSTDSQDQFITDSLAAHNNERAAHGVPALTWSTSLAQSAQEYAEVQASTGTTSHSTGRVNVGENLAWGSGKSVSTSSLAGLWIAEKKYFIAGQDFPDCSTTGSWHDVAHYTQLMWRKTTQLGCGIAKASSGTNYYVCHYSPQGNIDGESVY